LIATQPKPPILWVRGSDDMIVSDNSMFDFGTLGKMDLVPGWPGDDVFPPQPMVSQTRAVLEQYASEGGAVEEGNISITGDGVSIKEQYAGKGGTYQEHFIPGTAHAPQIEKPEEFNAIFHTFLAG
jgi:pimeloyl-ACP methyl ester carboxylesterase